MDDAREIPAEQPVIPEAPHPNGNGAPTVGRCESCEFVVALDACVEKAGKRYHLAALHPGKPQRGMRQCGPVRVAWFYWLAYTVTLPGQHERTKGGAVSFDAPISQPAQLQSAKDALAQAEAAKVKAVDRATGQPLLGAPLPEIEILGWQLVTAV